VYSCWAECAKLQGRHETAASMCKHMWLWRTACCR
jgi:hypothetical protein